MKKKYGILILVLGIAIAGMGMLLSRPQAALLENSLNEPDDGEAYIADMDVPLGEEPPAASTDDYEGLDETQIKMVQEVLTLVNEAREENGLSALTLDPQLRKAAQIRAEECVGTFSHTRPNGTAYKTAIAEAGVTASYTGENVATGQTSAAQVVKAWLNSPGHRANILNERFTRIGIGLSPNTGNKYRGYAWSQCFAN